MKKIITAITLLIFLLLSCSQDYMVMNNNDDNLVQEKTNSGSITITINTSTKREIAGLNDEKQSKTNLIESFLRFLRVIPKSDINSVTVKVDGYGIPATIESNIVITNGTGTGTISNIPIGKNRIISVIAKDGSTNLIPGAVLRTSIDIIAGTNSASIKWDTTPRGNVYYNLLQSDVANSTTYSRDVSSDALEAFIQNVILDNSITHPSLVNAEKISSDIVANSGILPVTTSGYKIATGSVKFTISDYTTGTVSAFATDPSSQIVQITANGVYSIANIYPGSAWKLLFTVDGSSGNIYTIGDVTSDVTTDIGEISLSTKVTLGSLPTATTYSTTLDVTVSGTNIVSYKYSLDGSLWSAETPISTHITASSLSLGAHSISVYGKDSFGNWQSETNATTHSWTIEETPLYLRLSKFAEPYTEYPCIVNLLFGITDIDYNPVAGIYDASRYNLLDDNQVLTTTEHYFRVKEKNSYTLELKTVIMVDISDSVGVTNLVTLKNAIKSIINNKGTNQSICLYKFDETAVLVKDFSFDKTELLAAVDTITLGTPSTNLYGSINTGLSRFDSSFGAGKVTTTYMIVMTDGQDTAKIMSFPDLITARGDKQVVCVGIGSDVSADALTEIGTLGANSGYYNSATFNDLITDLDLIRTDTNEVYNNICWLTYFTPVRSGTSEIQLTINGNTNVGTDSEISGSYLADGLYGVPKGVYVNDTPSLTTGITSISYGDSDVTKDIEVNSYYVNYEPVITFEFSTPGSYSVVSVEGNTYKVVRNKGGNVTMTVRDTANSYTKDISITGSEFFSVNFNTFGGSTVPSQYKLAGSYVTEPADPTREGYTFSETWYKDSDCSDDWVFWSDTISSDTTLYAKWTPNNYAISFDKNDVSADGTMLDQIIACDATADLAACAFTKTGYYFEGWATTSEGYAQYLDEAVYTMGPANVSLFAKWALDYYTIKYELDGGYHPYTPVTTYSILTETIVLQDPAKGGYTFFGWYDNSTDFSPIHKVTEIPVGSTGDKTLYARWSLNYNITYSGADYNPNNPVTYTEITPTITLEKPVILSQGKTGEWYSDDTYSEIVTQIVVGSTGDKTLYALCNVLLDFNIVYNLDGGTNDVSNPATYKINSPEIILAAPTKTGYTFEGWYLEPELYSYRTTIPTGSTGDINLYAKWSISNYNITYELDGGSNHWQNPPTYTMLDATIDFMEPTKSDFVFFGWFDNSTDFSEPRKITQILTGSTGNKTLYAKWYEIYDITYNLDGGVNNENNPATYTQITPTITLSNPVKTDCTFDGWYYESDFSGTVVTEITLDSTGDRTLYAKWLEYYVITYNLDGGVNHVDNPAGYTIITPTITLSSPTKTGYTFSMWVDDTLTQVTEIANGSTGNINLTAQWTINTYTVTYDGNGNDSGTAPSSSVHDYNTGATIVGVGDLALTGNQFVGWNTTLDGDGTFYEESDTLNVVNDITLYAIWRTTDVYTIGGAGPSGGWIFYDKGSYSDGWRYLEAAPAGAETSLIWQDLTVDFIGTSAQGTTIGTGKSNTEAIVAYLTSLDQTTDRAAIYCKNLDFNGFKDWFLPSLDELSQIYANLYNSSIGGFGTSVYWSSSEYPYTSNIAYSLVMATGAQRTDQLKSSGKLVRPIRFH